MFHKIKSIALLTLVIILPSCKKQVENSNRSILVLGNSITIHPPSADLGWYGNWGMAASSKSNDYIHILESKIQMPVIPVNISNWEGNHAGFDLSTLDVYLNQSPFLVIIRLGENVQDLKGLDNSMYKMIDYIQGKLPNSKILITGTFWQNVPVNAVLSQVAKQRNLTFVKLSHLDLNENISSIGATVTAVDGTSYKITNQAVAGHPNDVGMKKIAEEIALGVDNMMEHTINR